MIDKDKNTRVLVWAVFPPWVGWRGEGITQTLESILIGAHDRKYTLAISRVHFSQLDKRVTSSPDVKVEILGLGRSKEYGQAELSALLREQAGLPQRLWASNFFSKVKGLSDWLLSKILIWPQARRLIKSHDVIFNPTPSYSIFHKRKKVVSAFWDPFVFEYAAFGAGRTPLLKKFLWNFVVASDLVVTQSKANKNYLESVWGVSSDKIRVVRNGTPDYSKALSTLESSGSSKDGISRQNILSVWPRDKTLAPNDRSAIDMVCAYLLNKSVLFRLCQNLKVNSKIILISTQYRPYKGYEALFQLLDGLRQGHPAEEFHVVFTSQMPSRLREQTVSRYPWTVNFIYEFDRVSFLQHACLYKISDIVLHPSVVEGGPSLYPGSEAASLGIPSLTNKGRHTKELLEIEGEGLELAVADFLDIEVTIARIMRLLSDSQAASENIAAVTSAKLKWEDASSELASVLFH